MMKITRRCLLAVSAGMALPAVVRPGFGQVKTKVAGAHASPVENAWNSRLHSALKEAAAEGKIDYVFSESIANTDYPRALRQYAETGAQLIVGESYAVEREARQVANDYPKIAFLMGSSGKPGGENFGVFGSGTTRRVILQASLPATSARLARSARLADIRSRRLTA
jgi:basic membrane protein A